MEPDDIFKRLFASIPEVKVAVIVSTEGLPIASALPQGVDETRIAAITSALHALARYSILEMKNGEFSELYVKGSDGYLLTLSAGPKAVLSVSTSKDVRLGLIFLDCKRTAEKIAKLLSGDFDSGGFIIPYPYIPPDSPDGGASAKQKVLIDEETHIEPFCRHCGAKLSEGETICHVCGKKTL